MANFGKEGAKIGKYEIACVLYKVKQTRM